MPNIVSWEDAVGAKPTQGGVTTVKAVKPEQTVIPWDEAIGSSVFEKQAQDRLRQTPLDAAGEIAADAGKRLGKVGLAAADLFAGAPAGVVGWAQGVGAALRSAVQGNSRPVTWEALIGEELPKFKIPGTETEVDMETLKTPFQTVYKALTEDEPHSQEAIARTIKSAASAAEKKSGVPKELVEKAIGTVMAFGGLKGTHVIGERIGTAAAGKITPVPRDVTILPAGEEAPAPVDLKARRQALDKQIKESRAAETEANKYKREAEKFDKQAKALPEDDPMRAVYAERADVARGLEAERRPAPAPSLEERIGGTAYETGQELSQVNPGEAHREALAIQELAKKPGFMRTPEEMIQLRAALGRMEEGGFTDGKVAAGILAGTVTGAALYKLYQTYAYKKHIEQEQRKQDEDYNSREPKWEQDRKWERFHNPNPQPPVRPIPGSEGKVFLAKDDLTPGEQLGLLAAGGVMGAIKGKGGMWHPEAVARLAGPLKESLTGPGGTGRILPEDAWADKAVRNYLNKHAGTEGDPLAQVELPSGKKWGELTDALIKGKEVEGPKGKETQWNVIGGGGNLSLTDYLSHVGDYLRQNVPAAKLQQYDLVRAVKETAANDARVAKEMERAAAASMKDLPVYKDYGDGMKWVELKLAEKLTEEQAKGVRQLEVDRDVIDQSHYAVDAEGKPLKNSYTGEVARGNSPEEAHLAGQLAQEGNQMGHCVGGYCADVASGQTRILSLRDAKGKSHVTVEIGPGTPRVEAGIYDPAVKSPDILQIKGKQNRAPNAEYLPYVQDLVREGKWGEVGDLENTGLVDITKRHGQDGYDLQGEKFFGQRYVTRESADQFSKGSRDPALAQRGSADPKLLARLATITGGAALGASLYDDHPFKGAAYGAGIGLLLATAKPSSWVEAIKRAQQSGPVMRIEDATRQRAYAEKVAARATYQMTQAIEKAVPTEVRRTAIYDSLENERPVALSPEERSVATQVREYYNRLGQLAKDAGVIREVLDDYATRIYGHAKGAFEGRQVGGGASLNSPFGKPRGYQTRAEAEAAGYVPITTDIAQVLQIYSDSINKAIENRKFVETLKNSALPDGTRLLAKEDKAPAGYAFIDHPQLRGLRVHPDIAPDLRFIFDAKNPGAILSFMDGINSTQKRMGVSLSLFHAAALEHAMLGATSILKSPMRGARIFAQSFAPGIFGENLAVKMIRDGGAGDMVDRAMRSGLEFSFERSKPAIMEEQFGLYKALDATTKFLDSTVPGLGKLTTGAFAAVNHAFDRAMWGRFHAAMKLETFMDKVAELQRNNARMQEAGKPAKPVAETDRMAASFTNDVFGGLNWQGLMQEFTSRWGREVASAAFSPSGRFGMRMVMFAPDWTISTTRAFLKSFGQLGAAGVAGGVVGSEMDTEHPLTGAMLGAAAGLGLGKAGGLKAPEGSGVSGLLRPKELADLHRQYIMRSALIYTGIVDGINVGMSGHHLWENKDPTRLDRGDGTTQQVSKHFMEPIHWLLTPRQQAVNKLSFIVKEPAAQIGDVEYLSAHGAPRMGSTPKGEDISIPTRAAHVAKQFLPISAQGFESSNPTKAVASLLGAPIYGKTLEERAEAKAAAKQRATQRRINKRQSQK